MLEERPPSKECKNARKTADNNPNTTALMLLDVFLAGEKMSTNPEFLEILNFRNPDVFCQIEILESGVVLGMGGRAH